MRTWIGPLALLLPCCSVYGTDLVQDTSGAAGASAVAAGGSAETAGAGLGGGAGDDAEPETAGSTGMGGSGPLGATSDSGGAPPTDANAGPIADDGPGEAGADTRNDASFRDVSVSRGDAGAVCQPGACKRVFVSSVAPVKSGKLGGVAAMDTFCQTTADSGNLGGTWRAWLSDTTTSPSVRFTHPTVPYKLLNGSVVANDWTALTSGTLAHAINVFEDGSSPEAGVNLEVWTGTTTAGVYSGNACGNWTNDTAVSPLADVGASSQTGSGWTFVYQQFCNRTTERVYCFEQ